ncbi:MAG: hypothetical protein JNM17_33160 [Archangium sp.]|nr:hypothetical protein [Archangium sp.]
MSTAPQTVNDGPQVKAVGPQELINVSQETGMSLLTQHPKIWTAEAALIPPPPPPI